MAEQTPDDARALDNAERILGFSLAPFVDPQPSEPANAYDFTRIATEHAFNDAWSRTDTLEPRWFRHATPRGSATGPTRATSGRGMGKVLG